MPSALDGAPPLTFDTLSFPFVSRSAQCEFRHHDHLFTKVAGGAPEKQGRGLWTFSFECPMHATDRFFPDLYPKTLDALQKLFEEGTTALLTVPEIGTIRAFITKFERKRKGATKSGEDLSISFKEDDLEPLRRSTSGAAQATLTTATETVRAFVVADDPRDPTTAAVQPYVPPLLDLLEVLQRVLALADQAALYTARGAAQLEALKGLVRQLHPSIRNPVLWPLAEALRQLWDAAHSLRTAASSSSGAALLSYVVPRTQAVGMIAQALYGDAARGGEILSLNPSITDPYAVRAGTPLLVYAAAA